jgi:hypothetical protein
MKLDVVPHQIPGIEIVSFAVKIPNTIVQGLEEERSVIAQELESDRGIVGTITIFKKSAMVWCGWGQLTRTSRTSFAQRTLPFTTVIGSGT